MQGPDKTKKTGNQSPITGTSIPQKTKEPQKGLLKGKDSTKNVSEVVDTQKPYELEKASRKNQSSEIKNRSLSNETLKANFIKIHSNLKELGEKNIKALRKDIQNLKQLLVTKQSKLPENVNIEDSTALEDLADHLEAALNKALDQFSGEKLKKITFNESMLQIAASLNNVVYASENCTSYGDYFLSLINPNKVDISLSDKFQDLMNQEGLWIYASKDESTNEVLKTMNQLSQALSALKNYGQVLKIDPELLSALEKNSPSKIDSVFAFFKRHLGSDTLAILESDSSSYKNAIMGCIVTKSIILLCSLITASSIIALAPIFVSILFLLVLYFGVDFSLSKITSKNLNEQLDMWAKDLLNVAQEVSSLDK